MRNEKCHIAIDFKLPSNEILLFTSDSIRMTDRSNLANKSIPALFNKPEGVRDKKSRYNLKDFMAKKDASVLNSPSVGGKQRLMRSNLNALNSLNRDEI